jgi:hypothetical protein
VIIPMARSFDADVADAAQWQDKNAGRGASRWAGSR